VWGLGSRVQGLEFRVKGSRFEVWGSGGLGSGFVVLGSFRLAVTWIGSYFRSFSF